MVDINAVIENIATFYKIPLEEAARKNNLNRI